MVPLPQTMFNIPNLIEEHEYEFRIFAENEAGMSKPSNASRKVKVKDPKAATLPEFIQQIKNTLVVLHFLIFKL